MLFGFDVGKLDSVDITSKWTREEVTTCLHGLHINYMLPGDPREYWNILLADYACSLSIFFSFNIERRCKSMFLLSNFKNTLKKEKGQILF